VFGDTESGVLVRRLAGAFFIYIGRRKIMDTYKEMYIILFNAITEATKILQEAQKKAEEIFINEN